MKVRNPNKLPLIDYRQVKPLQGELKDLTEDNYKKLAGVLNKRGFTTPLFVWNDGTDNYLMDGHQRQRVMLGEDMQPYEVPYILIEADNIKDAKAQLLEITSQYGTITQEGFDTYIAQAELPEAEMMESIHFDALNWTQPEPEVEEDEAPEVDESEPPKSKLGEIYQLGRHRVMCGDSTVIDNIKTLMNAEHAQLLLTSPPYGVGMEYEDKTPNYDNTKKLVTDVFNNYKPVIKDNGFAFVNFGERFNFPQMMGQLYRDIFSDWHFYDMRYWKRSTVGMAIWNTTQPRCMSDMESLFTWQNGKKLYPVHNLEISKQSLWQADGSSAGMNHPAVMAVGIATNAITIYTDRDELVIDPFLGAGTTLIACEQTDRTCFGMELDPKYVDVIRKRYYNYMTKDEDVTMDWEEYTPSIRKLEVN